MNKVYKNFNIEHVKTRSCGYQVKRETMTESCSKNLQTSNANAFVQFVFFSRYSMSDLATRVSLWLETCTYRIFCVPYVSGALSYLDLCVAVVYFSGRRGCSHNQLPFCNKVALVFLTLSHRR